MSNKPSRKVTKVLQKSLKASVNEKDVENAYRAAISQHFPGVTSSPFNVDGLLECEDVRSLLEFKHNLDFKSKVAQCGVLLQGLFYIKKFEVAGKKLPTTVFVGDVNECFCMRTTALVKYLKHSIDWNVPPSQAAARLPDALKALVDDQDILPFVFDADGEHFEFGEVIEKISFLAREWFIKSESQKTMWLRYSITGETMF